MATTQEKATPRDAASAESSALLRKAGKPVRDWTGSASDLDSDPIRTRASVPTLIRPMESLPAPSTNTAATKGIPVMLRAQSSHPLEPLSAAEISVAVATVRAAGATPEVRDSMRFVEVALVEPDKRVVALADAYFFPPFQLSLLPRTKGGPMIPSKLPPRQARLVVYNKKSNETSIWIVELSEVHAATRGGHHRGKVISSEVVPDVQPPMDAVEYAECEAVVKDFPPFREAMKKRGIEDMDLVMVDPWCTGYHSGADAPSRRLAKPLIFCRTESDCPLENGYARPVEGIHVLVDMQNMVVLEFEDRKLVPLPPADPLRNYTPGETRGGVDRSDVKPLQIIQPEGPSFRVNGHFVEWQKWNFRVGFTSKEGLVIYSVAYIDGSRGRRPVAHRLSFVEMVVPYGDPNDPHYRKNAFDAGEDGLGKNAHSLKKGCDCLGYIKYFDANFTNFTGGVETIENCVCLHEEDHGILWKHQDWRPPQTPSPFLSFTPTTASSAAIPILSIKDPKALLSIIIVISIFALLLFLSSSSSSSSSSSFSSSAASRHYRPDPFLFPNQQAHRIIYHDNNSSDPTPPSIAYLLSGSKGDLGRILRLLHAAYHPRNQYLLHLDRSASDSEREKLALRVQSLPIFRAAQNVHVIGKADFVYPTGSSAISFTLHGASILLRLSPNWDWFISLSVRDYPLITQDDLLHIMSFLPKDLNFVNHSSYIGWRESRRLRPIIVDPGLYLSEKTDMFYATQKRVLPNAYQLFTGSSFAILSRNFIEFCVVGNENLPRTLLMYFSNTPSALSNYFPTILCNSQQFNKTIINHNLVYANSDTPPREKPQPISSTGYDAMIQHGAAFVTGLELDDPILDRVDREILKRRRGKVVPGGWCLGGFANDTCSVWGDADILRPSPRARILERLLVRLLSNGTFRSHQCIYE